MNRELRCSFCGGKKIGPMVVPVHPDVYPDIEGMNGVRSEIFEYIKSSKPLAEVLKTLSDETEHLPGGRETLWRLESLRTLTDLEKRGVIAEGLSQSATTSREKSLMEKIDSLRRSRIGSLPVMVSARCHFCRKKFLTCLACFPFTDQAVRRCNMCGIARMACVSCHASEESVCRECRESLKTIGKTGGAWILSEHGHTRYWIYRAPRPEYLTEFILVHYTTDTRPCPYVFLYTENVGIDHWHGGRTRFGHDHHTRYQLVYFDSVGSGDLIYAEVAEGVPHYNPLGFYACSQYGFSGPAKKDIAKLPDKDALRLLSAYTKESRAIPGNKEIFERTGVPPEALFFHYEHQETPQEISFGGNSEVALPPPPPATEASRLVKEAEVYLKHGFMVKANEYLLKAIEKDPKNKQVLVKWFEEFKEFNVRIENETKAGYQRDSRKVELLNKFLKKVAGFDPYAGFEGK